MYRLVIVSKTDYQAWLDGNWNIVEAYRHLESRVYNATGRSISISQYGNTFEYYYEFESEAEAIIFKLTYL